LEDNTIQIVEHRQNNSGLPQGDLVKRRDRKEMEEDGSVVLSDTFFSSCCVLQLKRIWVPKVDGSGFLTDQDLHIGAQVLIFGKLFTVSKRKEGRGKRRRRKKKYT